MIELIDVNEPTEIRISGTKILIRTLDRRQRVEYAKKTSGQDLDHMGFLEALSEEIISINGWDKSPIDYLVLIKDHDVILEIHRAVMFGFTEEQEKNSDSSLDTQQASPAGKPAQPVKEGEADVS